MTKMLTLEQKEAYEKLGYVASVRVMPAEQALALKDHLEEFERAHDGPLHGSLRHKTHLLFSDLNDLIRHEKILDAVEDLYGENLLRSEEHTSELQSLMRISYAVS